MYLIAEKKLDFWFDFDIGIDNIDITNFDINIYQYWFSLHNWMQQDEINSVMLAVVQCCHSTSFIFTHCIILCVALFEISVVR